MRPWSIHKFLPHLPCLIKPRLDLPFPTGSCATGSNPTQPALPSPFPTKRNATGLTLPNPTCHTYPRHPYRVKPALPHPSSPDHKMTQHSPPHLPKHNKTQHALSYTAETRLSKTNLTATSPTIPALPIRSRTNTATPKTNAPYLPCHNKPQTSTKRPTTTQHAPTHLPNQAWPLHNWPCPNRTCLGIPHLTRLTFKKLFNRIQDIRQLSERLVLVSELIEFFTSVT